MSSTREVCFLSRIQLLRCSSHLVPLFHSKRISSNPSPLAGRLNFVKDVPSAYAVRSGVEDVKNFIAFSSGVSFTRGGSSSGGSGSSCSSSSASSSTSMGFGSSSLSSSSSSSSTSSPLAIFSAISLAFFSAAAFFAAACSSFFFFSSISFNRLASAFFLAFSASFWRFSASLFLFASACWTLKAVSDFSCLSFKIKANECLRNSGVGSPITTHAVRLKNALGNLVT
mmetsp:Transcript_83452/g.232775  ORF Transcript_83452/g.232775 Transcript_83452/m.232775 type:complete len:227 (-) Transcript_83452:1189-1869(-)